jgi:hypothetical protein
MQKNLIITSVFKKNANFSRRKLGTIDEKCDHIRRHTASTYEQNIGKDILDSEYI